MAEIQKLLSSEYENMLSPEERILHLESSRLYLYRVIGSLVSISGVQTDNVFWGDRDARAALNSDRSLQEALFDEAHRLGVSPDRIDALFNGGIAEGQLRLFGRTQD